MKKNLPISGREQSYAPDATIISVTDTKGTIRYVNQDFVEISGFTEEELLGRSHNIVRHPDMPELAFKDLWDTLKRGDSWRGIVKNRCKNGDHYWVDAYVTPVYEQGQIKGYQSVRTKPSREQVAAAEALYARIGDKPGLSRLPRRRSVFNLSLKLRIFAALSLLCLLAVLAGGAGVLGTHQQGQVLQNHARATETLTSAWQSYRDGRTPMAEFERLADSNLAPGRSKQRLNEALAVAETTRNLVLAICVVGLGVVVVSGVLLVRTAVNPMLRVVDIAKGIAGGDLRNRIEVNSEDEIGQMLQAMKLMQARLRTILGRVAEDSAGLAETAGRVSTGGEQTRTSMRDQRSEVDQIATAINQMAATVEAVAGNTEDAAGAAQRAQQRAGAGEEVVERTRESIEALAEEVAHTAQVVSRLQQESHSIQTVMSIIRGIAEQTNLLALNAAIEAARAGEQGRGFAVVADEVRTLAQRTQEATKEIDIVIARLGSGIADAVAVMESGRAQAAQAVDQAMSAHGALADIQDAVTVISDMNTHIAAAAREQQAVADELNRNIARISEVAEQTLRGADGFAADGVALSSLAAHLRELVAQFRLAGHA